jgi:hypothetical protein
MSEQQLAPTLDNFDAIIAANSAKADAMDSDAQESPDAAERETDPGIGPPLDEPEEADPEEADDDEGEQDDEEPEDDGPDDDEGENTETEQIAARAPLKAMREALRVGKMTPQLMESIGALEVEIDLPGGKTSVPIKDLPAGYMRTARLHRELEKTRNDQQRAQHIVEIEKARTNSWRQDDGELERGLEIMGCRQAAEKMFWRWAQQKHAYMTATPEQRAQIDYMQQQTRERALERAKFMEMERELQMLKQQGTPQQDATTQHAHKFIEQSMDKVLGAAFKQAKAGKVSDLVREMWLEEVASMGRHGVPLDKAVQDAAELVADRFAERRELAQREYREQEAAKRPKEASPRRAPPAAPPQKRDAQSGRYTGAPKNGSRKAAPTASEFARRFGF